MCDRIVVIAQLDHRRWISCCEHGTTHLAWDCVSVRLPIQKLVMMNSALQECSQVARHFRIASNGEVCVVFDQYDLYQVWLGGVGLCLSPDDFQLFCQLVDEASKHPTAISNGNEPVVAVPDSPIRSTYHLFSVN